MTDKRYSKVEEEIIQILDQMEEEPQQDPPPNLVPFRQRPRPRPLSVERLRPRDFQLLRWVRRYSAGSWVGVGIIGAIVAWQLGRFSGTLGMIAVALSIAAFLAALYTRQKGSAAGVLPASATTKRWRGRDIDLSHPRSLGGSQREKWWRSRFKGPRR